MDVEKEDHKITRDNYKEYGGFVGKKGFFNNGFDAIKDKFDIEEGW